MLCMYVHGIWISRSFYLTDIIVRESEQWDDDQHDQDENNDPSIRGRFSVGQRIVVHF